MFGVSGERLQMKGCEGVADPPPAFSKQGHTVFGRGYIFKLTAAWNAETEAAPLITVKPRLVLPKQLPSTTESYTAELKALATKLREQLAKTAKAKAAAAPVTPPVSAPVAAPPVAKSTSTVTSAPAPKPAIPFAQPPVAPAPASATVTAAPPPAAPAPLPFAAKPAAPSSSFPPAPKPVAPTSTKSLKVQSTVTEDTKASLQLSKAIQLVVNSDEYKNCMQEKELLTLIALEAEGLTKKLARTMVSMVEQMRKLDTVLQQLSCNITIQSSAAAKALRSKMVRDIPDSQRSWRDRCDAGSFVFLNELLSNLIQGYLSQAHQKSTVWGFGHFVALLLRSDLLKAVVEPLWNYNLHKHTTITLPVWHPIAGDQCEAVIRLYTAVYVCLPAIPRLWTYTATVVNDIAKQPEILELGVYVLNAIIEIGGAWLYSNYEPHYLKLVAAVKNDLIPKVKDSPSTVVRLVQLQEALENKTKPEAYNLSDREKDLS